MSHKSNHNLYDPFMLASYPRIAPSPGRFGCQSCCLSGARSDLSHVVGATNFVLSLCDSTAGQQGRGCAVLLYISTSSLLVAVGGEGEQLNPHDDEKLTGEVQPGSW